MAITISSYFMLNTVAVEKCPYPENLTLAVYLAQCYGTVAGYTQHTRSQRLSRLS
jgi:hypothetical protein